MIKGKGDIKTRRATYAAGYGIVLDLEHDLPRKYVAGMDNNEKGFVLTGTVVNVLGALDTANAPQVGTTISITVRPGDTRTVVFDDLDKTRESHRFLLEGVTGKMDALEARWAHGAGKNRDVCAVEIIGVPHVSFENPVPKEGAHSGYLRLNLDGTATTFDVRVGDGEWITREFAFDTVVERLKLTLDRGLHFRVTQRVLAPSKAIQVSGQDELEFTLHNFRDQGFTSCVVRTFVPKTIDPNMVDMQILSWPQAIPATANSAGKFYEMPELRDTKRFSLLRDSKDIEALMEVIPGYEISLVGNPSDSSKSVKHKFVQDIVDRGMSPGLKNLYAAQSYGPGITIRAVNDDGVILGLTRLATRTEGQQFRNLMSIPTPVFPDADKIVFKTADKPVETQESTELLPERDNEPF